MGAKESRMKHEESEEAGEVSRTIDGYNTTSAVRNGMEQAINIKLR